MTVAEKFEAACAKVYAAETAGRSQSTLNRLYRAMFAAEDAMKLAGGWR